MRLADKTILIVGGTSGLGLSAARACSREGAALVLVGRDADRCETAREEIGTDVQVVAGDACDPNTLDRAIAAATKVFGSLDGLYHVAGGSGRRFGDGPLDQITDEGWRKTIEWNLDSLFYSNRAAVRQFLAQGRGGAVVNMTSVLAFAHAPRYFATHAYAASKSAVIGLTKSTAAYYASHNIRVNAIAPALVDTRIAERAVGDPQIRRYVLERQPLDGGRIGRPDDLDSAVVFLLSDESKYITGQTLTVDGGWSVSEGVSRAED